jgi:hypothetical protein
MKVTHFDMVFKNILHSFFGTLIAFKVIEVSNDRFSASVNRTNSSPLGAAILLEHNL